MPNRITPVVLNLIIINGLVFIGLNIIRSKPEIAWLIDYFLLFKIDIFSINGGFPFDNFHPVQVVTHFFAHLDPMHILLNMYVLFIFGTMLETVMGARRFLIMYLVTGVAAGLLITLVDPSPYPVLGASGAISGLVVAYAYYFPHAQLGILFLPFRFKARHFVMGLAGISAVLIVVGIIDKGAGGGISHFGHLAGMAAAYVYLNWGKILGKLQGKR